MKKALRKTLKITGIALGALVLLLVAAILLALFDKPLVRSIIRHQLGKTAGTTARFGRLDYTVFPFRVTVDSFELGQEDALQKLGVSLTRLKARGTFWKLVRGVKPAFDAIEADGVSFRLEQKAASEKPLDIEKALLQVSDMLAWASRVSFTNARLSFALLTGQTDVVNLDLTLTPGPAKDIVAYSIGRADLSVRDKNGGLIFASGLSSSGSLGLSSPFIVDTSFALSRTRFALAGIEAPFESLALAVTGRFDRPAQELSLSRLKLGIPGLLDLQGTAAGKLGHGLFLEAEADARLESLAAAAALLGSRLPDELRAAGLRGRAALTGKYMLQRSDQGSKDHLAASLSLEKVELDPVVAGRRLRVLAGGRIEAAGPSRDPRISADIRSSVSGLAAGGLSVRGADLHIVGSGAKAGADISLLDAQLAGLVFEPVEGKRIAFDKAVLTAKGTLNLARKAGVLTSLEARLPGLTPLRLAGRYGSAKGASSELRLEGRGLDVPALRALAGPFVPAGFAGWDLGGSLDLALSVRRPAAGRDDWDLSGTVSLAGAKFNDPSFTIAGEGLDPVLKLEGRGSASKGLSFNGSLEIGHGESLWRSVYVAWNKHPLKLTAAGRYDPGTAAIDGLAARALLPEVGSIDVTGAVHLGPAPSFDLKTEARFSLGPLYSLYTQAGVAAEARMKLEGTLAASLDVRKTGESLSVGGRVRLADTNVENPASKTLLIGVTADLPFRYESAAAHREEQSPAAGAAPEAGLPEEGHLRIGEFQSPILTLKPVDIAVRAGVNALAIEPLKLDLFGGRLELGRTTFRLDASSGSFDGVGSLALHDVDVSRFPVASPQFKLTGKIQADFPRLDIGPKKIAVSGRGEASVFGGKIVLRDLAVSNPFAPGRSISLNVDLVGLDMKKLTDEVPFGEVTGIVSGEIRDLVISYGQPERFYFRIESVPRKGVAQTFSLKAVDNLTVLSSGQQASGGTGSFWMSFIRGFRYQKLGIVSTLRNDTFTLNGTIHEGGTEYLVKKPALFGISVVNREPQKSISFKEMTSRLKRVGQSEK
jgi:hypothetical protein